MEQQVINSIVSDCISERKNIVREPLDFPTLLLCSNPFRFSGDMTVEQIVDLILERHKEKSEHTILGDLLERIAICMNHIVDGGIKSKEVDVDLEISEKNTFYGIKNSPKWGNANQLRAVFQTFVKMKMLGKKFSVLCLYGRSKKRRKETFPQFGGQESWYHISGDDEAYQKVWVALDHNKDKYRQFIRDIYFCDRSKAVEWFNQNFYTDNKLNFHKLNEYISSKNKVKVTKW